MSRRSAPVDPVDAVVEALAARLPRSASRSRDGLLQEAHDGLRDAAEGYERAGCSPDEAARRAVADFGDPEELAASYADEALLLEARRTSTVLAVGYLVVLAAWTALGAAGEHRSVPREHDGAASSFGLLGVLAAAVGAGTFVLSRRLARAGRGSALLAGAAGGAGLLCAVATLLASYRVQPWGSRAAGDLPVSPWTTPVEVLSGCVVAVILTLSVRCLGTAWRVAHPARRR